MVTALMITVEMVSVTSTVCPGPVSTVKVAPSTDWIVPTVARREKLPKPPTPPGAGKVMIPPPGPGGVGALRAPLGGTLVRTRLENAVPTAYHAVRMPATATAASSGLARPRRAGGAWGSADPAVSSAALAGSARGGGGQGSGVRATAVPPEPES